MTNGHNTTNAEILAAVAEAERRINSSLQEGLAHVNMTVSAMASAHTEALLDQEKRNGTFATRERLDQVGENAHKALNILTGYNLRLSTVEGNYEKTCAEIEANGTRIDTILQTGTDRSVLGSMTTAGWAITGFLTLVTGILVYVATHLH